MPVGPKGIAAGKIYGYRSGLEDTVHDELKQAGCDAQYETIKIEWEDLSYRKYTPDFLLPNGIIVETKGLFTAEDRRKHLLVKEQHPELDIRFVFSSFKKRLSKVSKTTYAQWCEKHGFLYAAKSVPQEWVDEPVKDILPQEYNPYKGKKHNE